MVSLRLAATLAHALPGLRLRVRDGQRTLLEVARPPLPAGPAMETCAFRMAVARAHERIEDLLAGFVADEILHELADAAR
jgi:hypothetical protein